jgi:hypothetical protein
MINKKLIIIMVVLVILIIVVGIGAYFMSIKKDTANINLNNNITSKATSSGGQLLPTADKGKTISVTNKNKKELTQQEKEELDVIKLANFFVSMLGSYSTDANFQNVIDLKPMMTDKMQFWADNFIKRNLDKNSNLNEYITTKVFDSKVLNSKINKISVLVQTRREILSDQEKKLYNQNAIVVVRKIGVNWLVDSVEWK